MKSFQNPFSIVLLLSVVAVAGCREQATRKLPPSNVATDENILFFPTYGRFDSENRVWRFEVHGKVFEPEVSSSKRAALIAGLRASADVSLGEEDNPFLEERIRPFLVDNERGKTVTATIDNEDFIAGTSGANGHFSSSLVLDRDFDALVEPASQVLEIEAVLPQRDSRTFKGRVHLIAPHGVSVISDVDDTIKDSQVTDKSELLQNTFLREFRAVEEMAELYADLAGSGAVFHYVSGSPWQMFESIDGFMTVAGFPEGTFHLKQFRLKDSSALDILASQHATKLAAITPLLDAFPQRSFILVGDSGEHDPEIYGQIAREHPNQIVGIFIRNVTGEKIESERFTTAFKQVPAENWALFDDVSQIREQILSFAKTDR